MARSRALALVFFGKRISQRDQDSKTGMQCIRSRECVGEHTKLQLISDSSKSELHTPRAAWTSLVRSKKGMFRSLIWEQFSLFPLATHLAHCPYLIGGKVLPQVHLHILAKAGSSMRVSGRFAEHIANSFYDPLLLWVAHSFYDL